VLDIVTSDNELILDSAPFRSKRFADGKLLEGEYGYGHIWK